ncbi:hypothetical protein DFP72DRAFT_1074377 [Ephemerocybe angulata]|uniref:Uncharacterized protein n=1 Tax=Ephemerocybe angulata TaxID=980116 RepID=A0A8H6HJQ6_9AGAR|nr:hypothetical protein DFP72DRAFT_1074377 [Tulosesus angulatus]
MPPGAPSLPNFSDIQRNHITSFIDPFISYLQENNPQVVDRHHGTSLWISQTAATIMKNEAFLPSKLQKEPAKVEKDIRDYFRNYKNNSYKKKLSVAGSTSTAPGYKHSKSPVESKLHDALRGLVILEPELSPKELFFLEAPGELRKAYDALKTELPRDTKPCTISVKARKRAWNEADQESWAKRKHSLELDVPSNQAAWPMYMREALQQNLGRGIVGSAVLGLMYAFRTEDNGVQHGILYAGHNGLDSSEIVHEPSAHKELAQIWADHAESFMPNVSAPSVLQFLKDDDGFALLPIVDIDDVVPREISKILTAYLTEIWCHGFPPSNTVPTIPWKEIAAAPHRFYDTAEFEFPCVLGDPAPCLSVQTLPVYDYLLRLQRTGNSFRFRALSEIEDLAKQDGKDMVDEIEKDDENMDDDVDDVPKPKTPPTSPRSPSRTPPRLPHSPPQTALRSPPSPLLKPSPSPSHGKSSHRGRGRGRWRGSVRSDKAKPRRALETMTNVEPSPCHPTARRSGRDRTTASFGLQLLAGGQRSPKGRRPDWSYVSDDVGKSSTGPPSKKRRTGQ